MHPHTAHSILHWYLASGVDECVEAGPINRFRQPAPTLSSSPRTAVPSTVSTANRTVSATLAAAPAEAIAKAREMANAANSLEALRAAIEAFDGCSLKKTATQTVFADGNPHSGVMLVGEAPGAEEDKQGIPFCGASGKLLDKMFESIGLPRSQFYITNSIFWRPPGNRTPSPEEIAICRPFVEKHIALIQPRVLVLIGASAAKALLNTDTGITRLRGKSYSYTNDYLDAPITSFATFHPSFLLRQSAQKRLAWHDLLAIESFIAQ